MCGKKEYKDLASKTRANGERYMARHCPGHLLEVFRATVALKEQHDTLKTRWDSRRRQGLTGSPLGLKNLIVLTTSDDVFVAWRSKFAA